MYRVFSSLMDLMKINKIHVHNKFRNNIQIFYEFWFNNLYEQHSHCEMNYLDRSFVWLANPTKFSVIQSLPVSRTVVFESIEFTHLKNSFWPDEILVLILTYSLENSFRGGIGGTHYGKKSCT